MNAPLFPISPLCLTSHFMCVCKFFTWWTLMCQLVLVLNTQLPSSLGCFKGSIPTCACFVQKTFLWLVLGCPWSQTSKFLWFIHYASLVDCIYRVGPTLSWYWWRCLHWNICNYIANYLLWLIKEPTTLSDCEVAVAWDSHGCTLDMVTYYFNITLEEPIYRQSNVKVL